MNELALFSGAGGGILGGKLLGWRTVCAVEIEPYCRGVLIARQNDHSLEAFPIWDDVRTFDGVPWRGLVDVVSGGFPCQDISAAGKGAGITGARSGLWKQFARIIGEVQPRFVLIENSTMLVRRGLNVVLADLNALGYDAKWGDIRAEDAIWLQGTPCLDHERKRLWIVGTSRAYAPGNGNGNGNGWKAGALSSGWQPEITVSSKPDSQAADAHSVRELQPQGGEQDERERTGDCNQAHADPTIHRRRQAGLGQSTGPDSSSHADINGCRQMESSDDGGKNCAGIISQAAQSARGWWAAEPDVDRMVHGLAHRVDRLRAIGNGQVSAVVKLAWETLTS